MATQATSAASGESNRTVFARSDAGTGFNRLRLDDATKSAFDLLLDLPIFETKIEPGPPTSDDHKPTEELTDEEDSTLENDASGPSKEADQVPVLLPSANVPDEVLIRHPDCELPSRSGCRKKVEATDELSSQDVLVDRSSKSPVAPLQDEPLSSDAKIAIDRSIPVATTPILADEPQNDSDPIVLLPHQERQPGESSDRAHKYPASIDDRVQRTRGKSLPAQESKQVENLKTLTPPIVKPVDTKRIENTERSTFELESHARTASGAPTANRRAERLEETRHGKQTSKDESDGESENSGATDHNGSIEIPHELLIDATATDPNLSILPPILVSAVDLSDPSQSMSFESSSVPNALTSIVATGNVALSSATMSTGATDADGRTLVSGIVGTQGTSTFTEQSASRSTVALPGRGSTLTAYQEQRVLQRMLKGLSQFADGAGQVRLRLHPPELGSLQITMRVEAQQVSALIEVEHTAARDVLLSNLPQLQSRLADQGMNVSQFDVQVVDSNPSNQGSNFGLGSNDSRGNGQSNAESERALDTKIV